MKLVGLVAVLLVLSLVFGAVQRLWPALPGAKRPKGQWRTDLAYWFFNPIVTVTIRRVSLLVLALPLLLFVSVEELQAAVKLGWGPVGALPGWQQMVLAVVVGDFVGYWVHRTFHTSRLWKFHAVHHSPKHLDWFSAVRIHPVNDVIGRAVQAVPLVGLGFSTEVLAAYVPFVGIVALLVHANVPWDFGPLRYVVVSPKFHRWHHTSEEEGLDKNFAGILPIWDLLFGTFYMPAAQPVRFGAGDDVPDTLWAQMLWPFRA